MVIVIRDVSDEIVSKPNEVKEFKVEIWSTITEVDTNQSNYVYLYLCEAQLQTCRGKSVHDREEGILVQLIYIGSLLNWPHHQCIFRSIYA